MDTGSLYWRCSCGETRPPTQGDYMSLIRSKAHKGHEKVLINKDTGEVVADSLHAAMEAGIKMPAKKGDASSVQAPPPGDNRGIESGLLAPTPPPAEKAQPAAPKAETTAIAEQEEVAEAEVEEEEEVEEREARREGEEVSRVRIRSVMTAGDFTYEITLPADAFMLFNLAKACGLERNGNLLFDEWVWDCIKARFAKDYKKELVLAPVKKEE